MRAIVVTGFGPPSVLQVVELPPPQLGPGQVAIDVQLANITFVDTQIRAGTPPNPAMLPRLPWIPGNGVGGVVGALGPGADARLLGRRVVSSTGGSGGYAERVAVDAGLLLEVPDGLAPRDALALLADGRTALALTENAPIEAGQVVLVEAAAGGVGGLLVQLARSAGARVVAAAGGARKLAAAGDLGADVLVDYSVDGWADAIHASGGVDLVFDGVGGALGRLAFDLVRPGGRFVSFGQASGSFTQVDASVAAERQVTLGRGLQLPPARLLELTREALALGAEGRLRPVIGQTFPLERVADAHAAIEVRATIGKTLLVVG
ncbi:MAG TPA: zinc-binding dehydrogenase [Chloroflexota bacterium]